MLNQPVTVSEWIEKNADFFQPPICNKLLYSNQLKVFFVGGPNQRKDYHIERGEEFFYQLRGNLHLEVIENGRPRTVVVREGECFLLPAGIPHSPQRFADTMGLVIERERLPHELDGLRYYIPAVFDDADRKADLTVQSTEPLAEECKDSREYKKLNESAILYERWFHCTDLGTQLAPIITQFKQSVQFKTGLPANDSCLRAAPYPDDTMTTLCAPVSMSAWLDRYQPEIERHGRRAFCDESLFSTTVHVLGGGGGGSDGKSAREHSILTDSEHEIFLWQLTSSSEAEIRDCSSDVQSDSKENCSRIQLSAGQCFLLNPKHRMTLETNSGGYVLAISMPSKTTTTTTTTNDNADKLDNGDLRGK